MFELGIGELALIAVVALLVLGPERLPGAARTVGALLRRARNSWQSVRADIERELAAEDVKQSIRESVQGMDVSSEINAATQTLQAAASNETIKPADEPSTRK